MGSNLSALANVDFGTGIISGALNIANEIGNFLQPNATGIRAQDATTVVNAAAAAMQVNDNEFLANPTPANQQAALAAFMSWWQWEITELAQFGGPGTKALNERAPGGKYDQWKDHYYPIYNYKFPTVASTSTSVSSGGSATSNTASTGVVASGGFDITSILPLLLVGIAVFAFMGAED
jgi:hypothetical protein